MLRFTKLLFLGVIVSLMTTSCGSKGNEEKVKPVAKVKPEKVSISGDLADYLQIVDKEYEVVEDWGGKLSIKIKAIKALTDDQMKDKAFMMTASLLNNGGMPVSGVEEFIIEQQSVGKMLSLLKKGSGEEVIQFKTRNSGYKAEEFAEKLKKFSVSSSMTTIEKTSSSTESDDNLSENTDEPTSKSVSNASPAECDQFMTDYEVFVNSYIAILEKYKNSPNNPSILAEYTKMMSKASSLQTNAPSCVDAKYVAILLRLNTKLSKVVSGIRGY